MNADQKQKAKLLVSQWQAAGNEGWGAQPGHDMAALLQELVDAPEAEPVAWQVRNGWAIVAIYQRQIDAENYAKDQQKRHALSGSLASFCVVPLYTAPPAPSVPLVLPEMSKNHIECIALDAGIEYCGDGVWRASPASMRDFAQRCINDAIPFAPTPAELLTTTNHTQISSSPAEPTADVARDAELLDALEDEVRSRGMHGLTLNYTNYVEDGLVVEKGFRLIGRKFIGPRRATLRDAIDAAIKRQGGE